LEEQQSTKPTNEETVMNKDQIRGKWEELKGKVKKDYGDTTADRKTQLEGAVQEGAGKVQKGFGNVEEDVKRSIDQPKP
jgi:uncharacterized protein YjbJ (UPF0337 family)